MNFASPDLGLAPRYHQVRLALRQRIVSGEWQPGQQIPTEPDLMRHFGVSRGTLRQAIDALVRQGLLRREQGRGTFVRRPALAAGVTGFFHFLEDLQRQGHRVDIRVLGRGTVAAPDQVAAVLDLSEGTRAVYIRRLILLDGEPFRLDDYYAAYDRFAALLDDDLEHRYLYDLLQQGHGVRLTKQQKWFEPVLAGDEVAELLAVRPGDPVLLIEAVSYGVLDGHAVPAAGASADTPAGTSSDTPAESRNSAPTESPVDFRRMHMRGDKCRFFVQTERA